METITSTKPQYLTNEDGDKIAVVIDIETYQNLLEELDELRCEKGYEQAIAETEPEIASGDSVTLEQYLANCQSKK
jgi:hypothetical protein